jgi:hypothetical protein
MACGWGYIWGLLLVLLLGHVKKSWFNIRSTAKEFGESAGKMFLLGRICSKNTAQFCYKAVQYHLI